MLKKFFLIFVIFFIEPLPVNAELNPALLVEGIGAWQFLQNWGYGDYWNKNSILPNERMPNSVTYAAFIPAKESGLANFYLEPEKNLGMIGIVTSASGEIEALRFFFDGSSPSPKKTMADAFSALIGKENFETDKEKFYEIVSNVLRGQKENNHYYSEKMKRHYIVYLVSYADGYELGLFSMVDGD